MGISEIYDLTSVIFTGICFSLYNILEYLNFVCTCIYIYYSVSGALEHIGLWIERRINVV